MIYTDRETLMEARRLRSEARNRLSSMSKQGAYSTLAKLLRSRNGPRFYFFDPSSQSEANDVCDHEIGIEEHVLEGLRKLNGPHGDTLFKALLAQHDIEVPAHAD